MIRRAILGVTLALLPMLAAAQSRPVPATCSRDLFQNEAAMRQRQYKMQQVANADQATQCAAWREHVAFLQKARSVFATSWGDGAGFGVWGCGGAVSDSSMGR